MKKNSELKFRPLPKKLKKELLPLSTTYDSLSGEQITALTSKNRSFESLIFQGWLTFINGEFEMADEGSLKVADAGDVSEQYGRFSMTVQSLIRRIIEHHYDLMKEGEEEK